MRATSARVGTRVAVAGRKASAQQQVDDVRPAPVQLGERQRKQLQARHVARQRLLGAGGAEDVRRAGEEEPAYEMFPRSFDDRQGGQPVGRLLDRRDQIRDGLELVQHYAVPGQRTNESVGIGCRRRANGGVVQGVVAHTRLRRDAPRQGGLAGLPRTRQVHDAELPKHLADEWLQVSCVQVNTPPSGEQIRGSQSANPRNPDL